MKLQCSCGAKYTFEVTPEMAHRRVEFVCPGCGADASEFVNQLVQREFGATTAAPTAAVSAIPAPELPPPTVAGPPRVRIHKSESTVTQPTPAAESSGDNFSACPRHPDEIAEDKCFVCSKPICPKCLELFGYVCSPLCKAKAASHGLKVPVFEGQRSLVEARMWRRTVRIGGGVAVLGLILLGFWCWYAWFGSAPKTAFSVRFPEPVYSGQSAFFGRDQIIYLRGGTLGRHDMKANLPVWSHYLIETNRILRDVAEEIKDAKARIDRANNEGHEHVPKMPSAEKLYREMEREAGAALELRVHGSNIWVVAPDKFTRFNPDTGLPDKELFVKARYGGVIARENELLVTEVDENKQLVTRVNLDTAESHTEEILAPIPVGAGGAPGSGGPPRSRQELTGLPTGQNSDKPMDPGKVAQQVRQLTLAEKLALPATLSNARNQERTQKELDEQNRSSGSSGDRLPNEDLTLLPTSSGFAQFSVRLVESRKTTRSAMKPPPRKSALEGEVSVANSSEVANEMLNEMQRERGGDVVEEDQSRYEVKVKGPDPQNVFIGETTGYPTLYPLQTVKILAAKNSILVLDKANRKLWQSKLNYNFNGGLDSLEEGSSPWGQGPCVERKDALYLFDEGVLTAFDLASGNVRWRYPSVGIAGLFFDSEGMLYVNTTTAGPQGLKYSRQIDINSAGDVPVVAKIDPRNGKVLWTAEPGGLVNYVSGKFLFTVQSYMPPEPDEDDLVAQEEGPKHPPYMRIKRINTSNGHIVWEHFQQRAPLDVQFDKNVIRLVFKREVQVLKFLAF
jgi:hypothetical protein